MSQSSFGFELKPLWQAQFSARLIRWQCVYNFRFVCKVNAFMWIKGPCMGPRLFKFVLYPSILSTVLDLYPHLSGWERTRLFYCNNLVINKASLFGKFCLIFVMYVKNAVYSSVEIVLEKRNPTFLITFSKNGCWWRLFWVFLKNYCIFLIQCLMNCKVNCKFVTLFKCTFFNLCFHSKRL